MTSAKIFVCSLDAMEKLVVETSASHLVSLINEKMMPKTPQELAKDNHLKLSMNDIHVPASGLVAPSNQHIEQLVDFVVQWDRSRTMVIHCWAGISRSTAAAFITLCALNPDIHENHIAKVVRSKSPTATPNRLLVSYADQHLGRSGRMIQAVEAIGRGDVATAGAPFSTPIILDGFET